MHVAKPESLRGKDAIGRLNVYAVLIRALLVVPVGVGMQL
jgi:hypothetical protein